MILGCGTYLIPILDILVRVFVKIWVRLSAGPGKLSLIPVSLLKTSQCSCIKNPYLSWEEKVGGP